MLAGMEIFLDLRDHALSPEALYDFLASFRSLFHYVVLDSQQVLSAGDWRAVCAQYAVILHTDTPEKTPAEAIRALGAAGVSIGGGAEDQTGVKSFDETDDFIDALI